MDEKELRTGNAVYVVNTKVPNEKVPGRITGCPKREVEYPNKIGKKSVVFEPVTITEDILLNNKFMKIPNYPNRYYLPGGTTGTYFIKKDIENNNYYVGMEDSGEDRRVSIPFIHLHQLQNAIYYIRGIEIEFVKY